MDPVTAIGAVDTGWNVGVKAGEGMLKYDRAIYEERLAELKSIKQELSQRLDTLKSMKSEIQGFWDDTLGETLSKAAQQWIDNIQEADNKLQSMIATTEDLIAGIGDTIGNAESTIESVSSAAKAVSGIIDGIGSIK